MNTIQKIMAVATVAIAALASIPAQAADVLQVGQQNPIVYQLPTNTAVTFGGRGWTNSINSYTSYTNSTRIDCTGKKELFLTFRGNTSSNNAAGIVTIWLAKNADGLGVGTNNPVNTQTNFSSVGVGTTPYWSIPFGANTGLVTDTTNLTVAAGVFAPYVFINIISNSSYGAGNNLTNYSITYWTQ